MPGTVRKVQIKPPTVPNDQLAADDIVSLATGSAQNAEQYENALISQVKRIIFGDSAGNFYSDFSSSDIPPLKETTSKWYADGFFDKNTVFVYLEDGNIDRVETTIGIDIRTTQFFYLESGSVDKIETTYQSKKKTDQFSYTGSGELSGIVTTVVDL